MGRVDEPDRAAIEHHVPGAHGFETEQIFVDLRKGACPWGAIDVREPVTGNLQSNTRHQCWRFLPGSFGFRLQRRQPPVT